MKIIRSLENLKKWNERPTNYKPILLEWFLDWFFEEVLANDDFEKAKEAYDEYLTFTMICEHMDFINATKRVHSSLHYYAGRSTKWLNKWLEFKKKYEL